MRDLVTIFSNHTCSLGHKLPLPDPSIQHPHLLLKLSYLTFVDRLFDPSFVKTDQKRI